MKVLLLILPLLIAANASEEVKFPEFSAHASIAKQHFFVLTNLQTKESSGWITVERTFQGFTIEQFDAEKEALVLRFGSLKRVVTLKSSRVVKSSPKRNPRTTSSHVEGGLELKLTMNRDRVLSWNGQALPGDTLDALLAVMARENDALLLRIEKQYPQEKPPPNEMEFSKSLVARMRNAGIKRGAINMTNVPDDAPAK